LLRHFWSTIDQEMSVDPFPVGGSWFLVPGLLNPPSVAIYLEICLEQQLSDLWEWRSSFSSKR
jgi:hypothetical protein